MEEEDQNQLEEKKFVCKFCHRRFQCGKSLGGHIRTHLNKKPTHPAKEKEEEDDDDDDVEFARATRIVKLPPLDSGSGGYRLRENPKKSWRFSDRVGASSAHGLQFQQEEKVCNECGKGFPSLKALCGHMACHSDKDRLIDHHKFEETEEFMDAKLKQLVMDSQSDTETSSAPKQRRVSKRLRDTSGGGGGSSGNSGVEQEQREVAISLMMLSQDSGYKGGLHSFAESSDNNSVVLETKSSSIDMRISIKRGLRYAPRVNDGRVINLKSAREKKLKAEEISVSDNSDSGHYRHEPKKVESDVCVDGFVRNGEYMKFRAEFGSRFGGYESYDVKSRKGFSMKSERVEDFPREEAYQQVDRGGSLKYALRKTTKNVFHKPFTSGSSGVEVYETVKKSGRYECLTCNRTFHSHRALGGHRASHTKSNGYSESMYDSEEDSIDSDVTPVPTPESKPIVDEKYCRGKNPINQGLMISGSAKKKSGSKRSKGHVCPFCFKVFKSGQALGGHKRSHFVGGCEVKTVVLGQQQQQQQQQEEHENELEVSEHDEAEVPTLFDLNLPAPIEEEANGNLGFMSW